MRVARLTRERPWFRALVTLRGSVVPAIWRQVLGCGLFGLVISALYANGVEVVSQPLFESIVSSVVLGLLLVFRTNTAYERFWEGRKCWGGIVNGTRNLVRQILVAVESPNEVERERKAAAIRLVASFSIAMKQHLRNEPLYWNEVEGLMTPRQYEILQAVNHPCLEIAVWIDDYLQVQQRQGRLQVYQLTGMMAILSQLIDALGATERILKTPVPLAYSIHLRQLLLIYCLALPFPLVEGLGWLTGPVVALVGFTLLGIEAIGLEIENPFGHDPNDLPLDAICVTIRQNMENLIQLGPDCGRDDAEATEISDDGDQPCQSQVSRLRRLAPPSSKGSPPKS
ncbi:MAG: hypothetical protein HC771_15750 [Synechococcales cyanobacterium CRU_2_2]|nr:hypothetical protein [Synechococcales cyanobacterium CRU_2_2]